jgi:hypothetical protein
MSRTKTLILVCCMLLGAFSCKQIQYAINLTKCDFRLKDAKQINLAGIAALNRLDWKLLIDQTEMAEGTTNQRLEVPPNGGVSSMTIDISTDVKKVLSSESLQSLANMVLNMADSGGKPTKLTLKAKPYISVGKNTIAYPGYINIKTEFTSE